MKSVKPGRAPSMIGGIVSVCIGAFGVIWTIAAASLGGGLFALFGAVFVIVAIVMAVYNFRNATGKNRYSSYDITDGGEESDPFNERFGSPRADAGSGAQSSAGSAFCPYCGAPVSGAYAFCNKCGKKLP